MQNESNVWLLLSITRVDWIRYEQFLSLRTAYLGDRCMNILELSNIIEDNLIIPRNDLVQKCFKIGTHEDYIIRMCTLRGNNLCCLSSS